MSNIENVLLIGQIVVLAAQSTDGDLLDLIFKLLLPEMKDEEVSA